MHILSLSVFIIACAIALAALIYLLKTTLSARLESRSDESIAWTIIPIVIIVALAGPALYAITQKYTLHKQHLTSSIHSNSLHQIKEPSKERPIANNAHRPLS